MNGRNPVHFLLGFFDGEDDIKFERAGEFSNESRHKVGVDGTFSVYVPLQFAEEGGFEACNVSRKAPMLQKSG